MSRERCGERDVERKVSRKHIEDVRNDNRVEEQMIDNNDDDVELESKRNLASRRLWIEISQRELRM